MYIIQSTFYMIMTVLPFHLSSPTFVVRTWSLALFPPSRKRFHHALLAPAAPNERARATNRVKCNASFGAKPESQCSETN